MRPGSGGAPTSSSSLPVASTCTTGRRWTATAPTPAEASPVMRCDVQRRAGGREHVAARDVLAAVADVEARRRSARPA